MQSVEEVMVTEVLSVWTGEEDYDRRPLLLLSCSGLRSRCPWHRLKVCQVLANVLGPNQADGKEAINFQYKSW